MFTISRGVQFNGSPASVEAKVKFGLSLKGRVAMTVALAKLSFLGASGELVAGGPEVGETLAGGTGVG